MIRSCEAPEGRGRARMPPCPIKAVGARSNRDSCGQVRREEGTRPYVATEAGNDAPQAALPGTGALLIAHPAINQT